MKSELILDFSFPEDCIKARAEINQMTFIQNPGLIKFGREGKMDPINEPATIQRAKQFLKDYRQWQLRKHSFSKWLNQPDTEMPQTAKQADFECQLRLRTLAA